MAVGDDVRVAVLGAIEVAEGDDPVALSPQLRRLLGVLVVADGGVVSADRLAEYVADGNAEGSTVRTAVSRLRKVLGDRIERGGDGYRLVLDPDELDAARFEQLVERARSAAGEVEVAALSRALELWRGPALGELAAEEWASGWAARADGLRTAAIEDLADALVREGRVRDAVELLDEHVRAHPYRERPVASLMRALAEDGRVADALRVFERFRVTLRDDTGLDPSAELRAVEAALLAQGDAVDAETVLPSGTVTFLFTDIEGSTQRWAEDEAAMTAALADHDAVLRDVVSSHGGVVFKHTGDGVCAVFASAPGAIAAAVTAQARLELPVRIGVHTGEAERRDGDYFGPTLNRVARIMDAGHGGQVLLSRATAALVPDAETVDLGEHRLKGLSTPERIHQVGAAEFPPLRVATATKGNLPADLTVFIGRDDELADVAEHLVDHRLVSLIGVGGTGKTRLALEVARAMSPTFPDGCWLAELARVEVADAVPHAIAAGLGIPIPEQGDVIQLVARRLRHQRLLLVVDNCEHVLDAAADVVEHLVSTCPTVTVLVTSREPLLVPGEQLVGLPSLTSDQAVELFATRAAAEVADFALDRHRPVVIELCDRLDRLPLAVELAASRVRTMSPVEILDRLDERFRLLVGGRRSRMERHQTMRGTVDWSYELCDDVERWVFECVSVFVGAFDAAAARAVACRDDLDGPDVDDALARLVDRSLVQRAADPDGRSWFSLLETMRAYGRERLGAGGESDAVRDRHADHLVSTTSALSLRSLGPDEAGVHEQLRSLAPDALVALDRLIERRRWDDAYRVTCAYIVSASGISYAMFVRMSNAKLELDGDFSGLEPTVGACCECGGGRMWSMPGRAATDRIIDALRGPRTFPVDALLASPLNFIDVALTDDELAVCERWLSELADAPLSVRVTNATALEWGLAQGGMHHQVLARRDRLQAQLDELGSDTMQIFTWGVWALASEWAGDLETAFADSSRSLGDGVNVTVSDVLNACRHLRIVARSGRVVGGDDLRLPFRWIEDGSLDAWRNSALVSAAIALDVMGHRDLAARCINVIPLDEAQEFLDLLGAWMTPRLRTVVAARTGGGDYDGVVDDIFGLAAGLDAEAEAEAER